MTGPVVQITLQQIYDKLVVLERDVARLVDQHDRAERVDTDHESRLRTMEDAQPARRLTALENSVEALKATRWPLPTIAVLLSAAALVWAVLGR